MPRNILGRVRGDLYLSHDSTFKYLHLDEVRTDVAHYKCMVDLPDGPIDVPLSNTSHWKKIHDVPAAVEVEVQVPHGDFRGDYIITEGYLRHDYVLKDGVLLRAVDPVPPDTTFNLSHWVQLFELLPPVVVPQGIYRGEYDAANAYIAFDFADKEGSLIQADVDIDADGVFDADQWTVLRA